MLYEVITIGHGDFRGGGVAAMADRVELVAELHDGGEVPPVAPLQGQARPVVGAARVEAAAGMDFGKGRFRITSYNVCYTKLLRCPGNKPGKVEAAIGKVIV